MAVALASSMPHSSPHEWLNESISDLKEWIEANEEVTKRREELKPKPGQHRQPKYPRRRGRR